MYYNTYPSAYIKILYYYYHIGDNGAQLCHFFYVRKKMYTQAAQDMTRT